MAVGELIKIIVNIRFAINQDSIQNNLSLKESIGNIRNASEKVSEKDSSKIKELIMDIKLTFNDSWVTERLPAVLKCKELLEAGIPTPSLSVCGKGTREIRYTQYLAYFLDPKRLHGLNNSFIRNVFCGLKEKCYMKDLCWDNIRVESEVNIGCIKTETSTINCFCDIEISDPSMSIFIEQKIDSSESGHKSTTLSQLQRYSKVIENNTKYKNKSVYKFYLTPSGKNSGNSPDWHAVMHSEFVRYGLKTLTDKSISITAKANLSRMLIDLVIGPYHKTEEILFELKDISDQLISNGYQLNKYIEWSNMIEESEILIELLEGVKLYENY